MPDTNQAVAEVRQDEVEISTDDFIRARNEGKQPEPAAPASQNPEEAGKPAAAPATAITESKEDKEAREKEAESKRNPIQPRIDELTRKWREQERENQVLRERLQKLEGAKPAISPAAEGDDPEPKHDAYANAGKSYEQWIADHTRWAARQELKAHNEKQKQAEQQDSERERLNANLTAYNQGFKELEAEVPDLPDLMAKLDEEKVFVPEAAQVVILAAKEQGPKIAHYLATHLDEAKELSTLSPDAVALKIGRIHAKLFPDKPASDPGSPTPKTVSAAPAPIKPVAAASARASVPNSELDTDEFIRKRNEDEMKRRQRR